MAFSGFGPHAIAWFTGLEQDNSREYFAATRPRYDQHVREPLLALFAELAGEFGGEPRMFRPHRDVRFSPDKRPYKTQASAMLHGASGALYYAEISADGLFAASGMYQMARDQLERFRKAVDDPPSGEQLDGLVRAAEAAGLRIGMSALKTAPRGYPRDHPRVELLRHTGMTVALDLPPGRALTTRKALTHVRDVWRAAGPINDWLAAHVGDSTLPDDRPGRR
jgi:uncharacterized protein (TIGR02453 family)